MGTNYYWTPDPCPTCGRGERIHIGKSSAGWCFLLHVIPEEGIETLADWQERWGVGEIRDEYGGRIDPGEMLRIITERNGVKDERLDDQEFLARNYARVGPRNLLRSVHRSRPGEGTYDLVEGEFS